MTATLRTLALHVAVALAAHERACRSNGVAMPAELRALTTAAWELSRGDHERPQGPTLAATPAPGHCRPMLLTIAEAAAELRLSPRKVQRLVASGALASVTIDSARRIRLEDLRAYVAGLGARSFRDDLEAKVAARTESVE